MHLRKLIIFFSFSLLAILAPVTTHAQSQVPKAPPPAKEEATTATVTRILSESVKTIEKEKHPVQKVQLQILQGNEKGKTITVSYGEQVTLREDQKVYQGEKVVVMKSVGEKTSYQIIDHYRLDTLLPFVVLFLAVVLLVSRLKGLGALIGLVISFFIILKFIVPLILTGEDPLLVSIVGSCFIMVTTMYVAHGFSKKTNIALFATCLALLLTGILAYVAVNVTQLSGLGSEDAASLLYGQTGAINFQGLLLGGIIIGSLGVLNDITIGLAAALHELSLTNHNLTFHTLFKSGLRIGSEHIAALVNTLALAYAGAGLPIFIFLVLNPMHQPFWLILNSELLTEEIVRTLAGSIGLILAVPLTALFGALAFSGKHK